MLSGLRGFGSTLTLSLPVTATQPVACHRSALRRVRLRARRPCDLGARGRLPWPRGSAVRGRFVEKRWLGNRAPVTQACGRRQPGERADASVPSAGTSLASPVLPRERRLAADARSLCPATGQLPASSPLVPDPVVEAQSSPESPKALCPVFCVSCPPVENTW